VRDVNDLYKKQPALYFHDFDHQGFEWIDCNDAEQSVISYIRRKDEQCLIVILNFTPVPRHNYAIRVPEAGKYTEIFNSDSEYYHGSNMGNLGTIESQHSDWESGTHTLHLTLPPLAAIVLKRS
jgi:1,4-alpha-glucan branching enzyme